MMWAAARVAVAGLAGHGDVSISACPGPEVGPAPDDRGERRSRCRRSCRRRGRRPLPPRPSGPRRARRPRRRVSEADRHAQHHPDRADEVGVAPAGLGGGGDVPVARVAGPQLDGAERRNARHRGRGRACEERHDLGPASPAGRPPFGMRVRASMSSGEEPSRQTNFVPPASTAPGGAGATWVIARTVPGGGRTDRSAAHSGDGDPEAVTDDRRGGEQAHARNSEPGRRAAASSAPSLTASGHGGPG